MDPDGDLDLDLYLANDHLGFRPNVFFRNERGGERFVAVPSQAVSSMGVGLGDITGDGRIDIAVSDMGPPWVLPAGSGRARLPGPGGATWGVAVEDFDNDGDEDVLAAGGALGMRAQSVRDRLWLADGRGGFRESGAVAGVTDPGRRRGVATADVDGDGLLDVLVGRLGQPPLLLRNRGAPANPEHGWLRLRLRGTRSPADACGARVRVRSRSRTLVRWVECGSEGFGSSSERVVHVGLGASRRYEAIEILWPSGLRQRLGAGRGQRLVDVVEPGR